MKKNNYKSNLAFFSSWNLILFVLSSFITINKGFTQTHQDVLQLFTDSTIIAQTSGSWSDASTWGGILPTANDKILIPAGISVTLDQVGNYEMKWLRINGNLFISHGINILTETILVEMAGSLEIGSTNSPIQQSQPVKITFKSENPIDTNTDRWLISLGIIVQGSFVAHGEEKRSYATTQGMPEAGDVQLTLEEDISNWRVGDKVVLNGTYWDFNGSFNDNTKNHDEELIINTISGNTITFTNLNGGGNSLLYDHLVPNGYNFDLYVANLSRAVVFDTENWSSGNIPFHQRGHFIGHHSSNLDINYVGFYGMGKTNKDVLLSDPDGNGGGLSNPRGRYPFHIHKAGFNSNPANVKGCVVEDSPGWAFVNHSSHVIFKDNVSYNVLGSHFNTEDGDELGAFENNIAIKAISGSNPADLLQPDSYQRGLIKDFGVRGTGYWITSSYGMTIEDNIAVSCEYGGFLIYGHNDNHYPDHKIVMAGDIPSIHNDIIGNRSEFATWMIPITSFKNNTIVNSRGALDIRGITRDDQGFDSAPTNVPTSLGHQKKSVFENGRVYASHQNEFQSNGYGIQVIYASNIHIKDWVIIGNKNNPIERGDFTGPENAFGAGIYTNKNAKFITFQNNRVEGWDIGNSIPQVSSNGLMLDYEHPIGTSSFIGGYYANNNYNFFPSNGNFTNNPTIKANPNPGVNHPPYTIYTNLEELPIVIPKTGNMPPVADFEYDSPATYAFSFDGLKSVDMDFVLTYDELDNENTLPFYVWDFGDGSKGYGAWANHVYQEEGLKNVTLTVYDSDGASASITKEINVVPVVAENIINDPGFDSPWKSTSGSVNNRNIFDNPGEYYLIAGNSKWELTNQGTARFNGITGAPWLVQGVYNDSLLTGSHMFSTSYINTSSSEIQIKIWGVNGRFVKSLWSGNSPENTNVTVPFSESLILDTSIEPNAEWTTFTSEYLDLGDGYEYYIFAFTVPNYDSGNVQIDNLFLGGGIGGNILSIEDQNNSKDIHVYPNPVKKDLNINFQKSFSGSIQAFNLNGANIFTKTITDKTSYVIDLNHLNSGIYFFLFRDTLGQLTVKKISVI